MRASIVLLLALAAAGCAPSRPTTLATADGRAEMNARTANRGATLRLRGAPARSVRNLRVGPDETTWVDRFSGLPQSAPTTDVASIAIRRGSIWRPLLIGAATGVAVGAFAATQDGGGIVSFPPGLYMGIYGTTGAVVGAGVGVAQTDRYRVAEARLGGQVNPPTVP